MTHPPLDRLKSYAHAEADVTGRLLMEAHLAFCASCSARVADYRRMDGSLPTITLDDQLDLLPFDRVWTAVTEANVSRRTMATVLPPPLLTTLPQPHARRWVAIAWPKRVRVALLIRDADTGSALYLCHFAPGSRFPYHRHVGLEENVILAGGYRSGNILFEAGDWVAGEPGSEEIARAEDEECWCLSRLEPPGVRFAGWRRWLVPFFSG
jgi:predicted ChrR family anti-sigma factor